jgi:hypothetical protein
MNDAKGLPVITDERLTALIQIYDDYPGNNCSVETASAFRDFVSLRAKHDKIMEALREADIALFHGATYIDDYCSRDIGDSRRATLKASASKLRALSKLGEGE